MFIKHDYKCFGCGHIELDVFLRRSEMHEYPCPECGDNMSILPCAPNLDWDALAMGSGASPEAVSHFERKRKQQKREEKQQLNNITKYS